MEVYILDACGLIAFLRKEEGHEKITAILDKASDLVVKVLIHAASVSEVYYDFWKRADKIRADNFLSDLNILSIDLLGEISIQMIEQIGYFKTKYKISFADSFVLAAAKIYNAKVITSDHHEFDIIEKSGDVTFEWIR
ncbi:MAG TPA: PIN domain-containing protein [Segetibacter sp.]|jgi:predicted nucleic acid-binding protein